MMIRTKSIKGLILVLIYLLVIGSGLPLLAKKDKGLSDKEAQKILTEADKSLSTLLGKTQNRQLLSPEESGQLESIHFQLLEVMTLTKVPPQMAKVLYQAGLLHERREQYDEAYVLYEYLSTHFSETPYGSRSKLALMALKKHHAEVIDSLDVSDKTK